jgi:hypothetical protein
MTAHKKIDMGQHSAFAKYCNQTPKLPEPKMNPIMRDSGKTRIFWNFL